MLIRYNKFDEATRDRIRALESKGHIGYIRYLMMRRVALPLINDELMRLGLSWAKEEDLRLYFKNVLYPIIQGHGIESFYTTYRAGKRIESLTFQKTFLRSEIDRKKFCACITDMEIEFFFSSEIIAYYGTKENIPTNSETSKPIVAIEKVPDFIEVLNHPKRHLIESMMIDGKTPKMISDYLDKTYDIQLPAKDIFYFANAFFKTKRKDLERTIDDLQAEVVKLEESIHVIREANESKLTIGEKASAIANAKNKIEQLNAMIKRLMGHHSQASYNAGILEFAQIREMFADVMLRTHRRFIDLDRRTEDDIVNPLATLVGSMAKATDKIMALDEKISSTTKKTVAEEMLEVVMPTLDRVLEEEREAYQKYQKEFGGVVPIGGEGELSDSVEILGLDD